MCVRQWTWAIKYAMIVFIKGTAFGVGFIMNVNLLDCTLRDGGYVNNWDFGASTIACIFDRLVSSKVDIIEIGFLDDRTEYNQNRTIQPTVECFERVFENTDKNSSTVVVMIDYGTCALENISIYSGKLIDGIRLIFKKPDMKKAAGFGRRIKEKGYKLLLQLVSITDYSDRDIIELCDIMNEVKPSAVSIVDTYGLMHKDEMLHYYYMLNRNLSADITIGYHSHNNFQLAYANTVEIIKKTKERNIIVDGTIYGMGKGAGNAPLELLALYLNENHGCQYDISQMLEILDVNISRIYEKKYWGYSMQFFLSASNDCHPSYISYLLDKRTLSVKALNQIVQNILPEFKLLYNQDYIEELYITYQKAISVQEVGVNELVSALKDKDILLIGPGKTILEKRETVTRFISTKKPTVIAVNCMPGEYTLDYVFLSNSKRYSMLYRQITERDIKIIATSNISTVSEPFEYLINYEQFLDEDTDIEDSGLAMILNFLIGVVPRNVFMAGFDGYAEKASDNFYEEYVELSADYERLVKVNYSLRKKINQMKGKLNISFVTPSLYED